ncbi:MAG: nuclear transport factor 2 family protein [Pseudomonadota bacterium]|nr:nuclear transport factor 2 family protein [Pseudomonadota bacterium]
MTANTERVVRFFDHWHAARIDDMVAMFAPDGRFHFSATTKPPAVGHDEIRKFLTDYSDLTVTKRLRINAIAEAGSDVFYEAVEDFDLANGRRVITPYAGVVRVENGRFTDWRDYFDRATIDGQVAGERGLPPYAHELLERPGNRSA